MVAANFWGCGDHSGSEQDFKLADHSSSFENGSDGFPDSNNDENF
jgi:hypothetical protein